MEVVLAKVCMSQYHMFDSCFWFVWLVCWSVCCITGDVGDELISTPSSQSDVMRSSLFLLSVHSLKCGSGTCNKVSASCCSCLCKDISRKTCSSQ